MPFCHSAQCRCERAEIDRQLRLDGSEVPAGEVAQRLEHIPCCCFCGRPMWESLAKRMPALGKYAHCEPRKTRDNCPTFGARDYAASLKAIAERPLPGVLSETYSVADVPAVQKRWAGDDKALAKAMKMRAELQAVLAKKSAFCSVVTPRSFAPIAQSEERVVAAPVVRQLSAKEQKRRELHAACYQALKTYRVAPTEANLTAWDQAKKEYANA